MMSKLNAVLLLALLASCLFLVNTAYESRRLFAALDKARAERRQLDAEFKRLDAEAQAQATHLRVEKVAREKLRMRTASPAVTDYVTDPAAPAVVASGKRP
jgi:cell division protein FtsL